MAGDQPPADGSGQTLMSQNATSSAQPLTIHIVRGVPVVMDVEVAALFGVETRQLNQQVKRNADKFGDDLAFALNPDEFANLKSQNVTSSGRHGGRRKPPTMFTEHGVVMAATVLKSEKAAAASRYIVRVFVEARRNQLARAEGRNLPLAIDAHALLPGSGAQPRGMVQKTDAMLGRVLDSIVNPREGTTLREEAEEVVAEGLGFIKQWLQQPGKGNEKVAAEIEKMMAERDHLRASLAGVDADARIRQLAAVARELRLVLAIERARESGSVEELMQVLKDLGNV